jgi:hypothetical protein
LHRGCCHRTLQSLLADTVRNAVSHRYLLFSVESPSTHAFFAAICMELLDNHIMKNLSFG